MHRRSFLAHGTAVLTALVLPGCASEPKVTQAAAPRFGEAERKAIIDFFARQRSRGPIDIPAQTVKAGSKLPSGPRRRRLPRELEDSLSALSAPYQRLIVGADVILLNSDSDDILDVIPQVAY